MVQFTNKLFIILVLAIIACGGGGGGSSPTDPSGGTDPGDGTDPYSFPNATNLDQLSQIEIVTWNIREFLQRMFSRDGHQFATFLLGCRPQRDREVDLGPGQQLSHFGHQTHRGDRDSTMRHPQPPL